MDCCDDIDNTVPPVLVVVKLTATVVLPLQITWLAGWSTAAAGLTVTVNDFEGPSQVTVPFSKCGVTTMVAVTGEVPALMAVNAAISPVPLGASPMLVVLLVQVYVAVPPVVVVVKFVAATAVPWQTTWLTG